jgi:hypothetical protein
MAPKLQNAGEGPQAIDDHPSNGIRIVVLNGHREQE